MESTRNEMSVIKNFATAIGDAVGSFERARELARTPAQKARPKVGQISRPQWLADMALEGRWSHGEYFAEEEAQRRALVNGWWFSAIAEIAGEVSGAGLNIVTQTEADDEPEVIKNHPFVQLLRKPNPWMSRAYLWAYTVQWMKMDGNAFWFLAVDGSKELREIWPLPSNDVEPWPSEDPQRFIDYYIYRVYGKEYHIPPEYICHIQNYPNPFNIFDGLSELAAALLPVDADLAMARWNAKFFDDDNVMPSAVINLKSGNPEYEIDAASVESMRHDLTENYQANERKTFVTWAPGGIDVQMLGWSMRDMEFQGGRQMTRQEIFEVCGIPEGRTAKNATEANAKVGERIFKSNVYNRSLVPIQEQITAQIIIPCYGAEYRVEFIDIRPADREMEMQELEKGKGALTVNEVRTKYYNLPELEDERGQAIYTGQEPVVPSSYQVPPSQEIIDGTVTEPETKPAGEPQTEQESQAGQETQQELDQQQAQQEQDSSAMALPFHDGVMVAFFPSEDKRNEFFNAIPDIVFPEGSERLPADELHLTLAYMGSISEGAVFEDIYNAVVRFAQYWAPLEGEINGTGRFAVNPEGNTSAFYASFESPELPEFRQALINRLADFGVKVKRDHGFTHHMTLAYIPGDARTPSFEPPKI